MAVTTLALPRAADTSDPARSGILPFAVGAVGGGALMVMGGLVAAYLALKSSTDEWPPADTHFDNYTASTLTVTVFMAMVSIEWAAYGIRKGFRGQALFAFALSALLAAAHLNGLGYLINGFEFAVADSPYALVVHALALVPFLLGFIAAGAIVLTGLRAIGHQLSTSNFALMRACALTWHVAAVAWLIAYYAIYITK